MLLCYYLLTRKGWDRACSAVILAAGFSSRQLLSKAYADSGTLSQLSLQLGTSMGSLSVISSDVLVLPFSLPLRFGDLLGVDLLIFKIGCLRRPVLLTGVLHRCTPVSGVMDWPLDSFVFFEGLLNDAVTDDRRREEWRDWQRCFRSTGRNSGTHTSSFPVVTEKNFKGGTRSIYRGYPPYSLAAAAHSFDPISAITWAMAERSSCALKNG